MHMPGREASTLERCEPVMLAFESSWRILESEHARMRMLVARLLRDSQAEGCFTSASGRSAILNQLRSFIRSTPGAINFTRRATSLEWTECKPLVGRRTDRMPPVTWRVRRRRHQRGRAL